MGQRELRVLRSALVGAALAAGGPAAWAEGGAPVAGNVPPKATGWQLVHRFDFEEREEGNFEDMPRYWYVIGRPPDTTNPNFLRYPLHERLVSAAGFAAYSRVGFDESQYVSGAQSFGLSVDGGGAGAFLEVGAVPAVPGCDYQVTAWVRTHELTRATTQLLAYLVDAQGQRIEGSVARVEIPSQPAGARATGSERGDEPWQAVALRVVGEWPQAAWIGLELAVMQPGVDRSQPHQIAYQDVRGGAWFDDVCVWQVPRLTLSTPSQANVIRWPKRPQLDVQMRQQRVRGLLALVRVFDHRMRVVASARRAFGEAGAEPHAGAPNGAWNWQPELERFGWYLAELTLVRAGDPPPLRPLDRALCAFAWLPARQALSGEDAALFGIDAAGQSMEALRLLPAGLKALGLKAATVSCWPGATEAKTAQGDSELDRLLAELSTDGVLAELSLWPVPAELGQAVMAQGVDPVWFLASPKERWLAYLEPIVMRHGQEVKRWRLGPTDVGKAAAQRLAAAEAAMRELAPGPRLVLPCGGTERPAVSGEALGFAVDVPVGAVPAALPAYLEPWQAPEASQSAGQAVELVLRAPAATQMEHRRRVEDLVLRMLYCWQTGSRRLSLAWPWCVVGTGQGGAYAPDPVGVAFAMTAQRLAGRRFVGWLPLGPGLKGMLFDGEAGGMLAAWNETAQADQAVVRMYLGQAPLAVDVWGNQTEVTLTAQGHELALGSTPVFVEGIDAALALFRSSFRMEPPLVMSMQSPQDKELVLTNTWSRTISGRLVILRPRDWAYQPQMHEFSIPAGQTHRLPVRVSFPTSELAGYKELVAKFELTADQPYTFEASAPLTVGLPELGFEAQLAVEPGADGREDALVTQVVTNRGERTLSLYAFASLPQQPLQEKSIQQLLPGQSVVRSFRFTGAGKMVRSQPVRVGVRETSGPAGLNQLLRLE